MENKKLTLDEFIKIKNELAIINESCEMYMSESALYETHLNQYKVLLTRLLSYDLSEIPFEEWNGIALFSDDDYTLDFSKARANIDFEIISPFSEFNGKENFKNCNIKNLDFLKIMLRPENFDQSVVDTNTLLFLSDIIPKEIKELYYQSKLVISDLSSFTEEQLNELEQKNAVAGLPYKERIVIRQLGFVKSLDLFKNTNIGNFNLLVETFNYFYHIFQNVIIKKLNEEFLEKIKNTDSKEIKNVCFYYLKEILINAPQEVIVPSELPGLFVDENPDFLLSDESIPQELRERYYTRNLTFEDLVNNYSLFENIPIDNFIDTDSDIYLLAEYLGFGNLQKALNDHLDFITHIINSDHMAQLINRINRDLPFEKRLSEAAKKYLLRYGLDDYIYDMETKKMSYSIPEWIQSFNFKFLEKISTLEEFNNLDYKTIILHEGHRKLIEKFGLENVKKLEEKTGYFSHKSGEFSIELENFFELLDYFSKGEKSRTDFDFKNGILRYEEFEFEFIKLLNTMRKEGIFEIKSSYDWLTGNFRKKYEQYFISEDAPDEVKEAFYKLKYGLGIKSDYFYRRPNLVQYFKCTNLSECLDIEIHTINSSYVLTDFVDYYTKHFGNEEFLKLMVNYGIFCHKLEIPVDEELRGTKAYIDAYFRKIVTARIVNSNLPYDYLKNVSEYFSEFPEMFVDFSQISSIPESEQRRLESAFYNRIFSFNDIKMYPELVEYLKNKNLFVAFGQIGSEKWIRELQESRTGTYNKVIDNYNELEFIKMYGNEKFLKLCLEYGNYLGGVNISLHKKLSMRNGYYVNSDGNNLTFEEIKAEIEIAIAEKCLLGELPYHPETVPIFLKDNYPELFLNDDAPRELKDSFYDLANSFSFLILENHKEWLPYLEGKSVETGLLRGNRAAKRAIMKYFKVFGDKAVKLGVTKGETVTYMIEHNKIDVMKNWYDLTGKKFVPDLVVMENFSLEEADKFFTSTTNWTNLLKIREFSKSDCPREAMLKLAYAFGVFDQDLVGLKKLQTLLTDIPHTIDVEHAEVIERICELSGVYTNPSKYGDYDNVEEYKMLADTLESEQLFVDRNNEVFSQIYKKNENGSYTLAINTQKCPKTTQLIRKLLSNYSSTLILSPNRAYQLFGMLELRYDKDFREFLLANMSEILNTPECGDLISNIHTQFEEIKAINSNRKLTLNLAISFVQSNRFINVNTGNERVAEVSAIAGYGQYEFNTLQKIYNYGKQRTFSSIPRIENTYEKYNYGMLRLDDPYAMVIGDLTECCQRLGREGEVCMEHSMVDKHGRIFVVKDDEGNIIAQSWVWRNKDVLCFDNIEIPKKAFQRAERINPDIGREKFSDKIYEIYKQAAYELVAKDEEVYSELLKAGKITEEQYDNLRLRKITVGLGYNDIAVSISNNAKRDKEKISRPLHFTELVNLPSRLYIEDSIQQYVLFKNEDRKVEYNDKTISKSGEINTQEDFETLPVYSEEYILYDDSNFKEKLLLTLQKLEFTTKGHVYNLTTSLDENAKFGNFITEISKNYGLNSETCKIIMNPNFAIIFDLNGEVLRIGEILYNTYIHNKEQQMDIKNTVIIQIRLALEQIAKGKSVDISRLTIEQKEMYEKAMNLTDELDLERGIGHAK